MKKLLSILLLGLLVFNMMGFSVYTMLEDHTGSVQKSASANYNLLLKFPLALPYLSTWENAEPSNEELLKGNEYYKIMSKQIINDTLYVQCEFSQTSRERFWSLVSTFDDHVKTTAGSHAGKPVSILKNFLKEYMAIGQKHTFYILEWSVPALYCYVADILTLPESSIPSPPPDLV